MKKVFIMLVVMVLAFSLSSCTSVEDTNGADDTSLNTITMDDLLSNSASWSTTKSVAKSRKTTQGFISGNHYNMEFSEDIDHDYYSFKCGSASGVNTMMGVKLYAGETV